MSDRHSLVIAIVGGLAAGGLALLGASRTWARAEIAVPGVPSSTIEVSGTGAVPWVGALTLVILAGALAIVPTGGWLRRVVGAVIVLAAAGAAIGVLTAGPAIDDALSEELAESPASGGVDDAAIVAAADHPAWRWLSLSGSVAGIAVGLLVTARGHRWATMGSRYDAPAPRQRTDAAEPEQGASAPTDDADLWRALDEGRDPTA
ncbi:MAG: Trp biosynthesis-associated membrane protein [Nocardioidaceae bacterium]